MLLSSAARSPHGAATARVTWTQLLSACHLPQEQRGVTKHAGASDTGPTFARHIEAEMFQVPPVACVWCAQAYAQRKTNHPRSTVHPRRQVAVLWQLLTLTATCKWMAHMTADAGTLTADVTKLLERSGRLGSHRVATFTFGVRCFDEPVGPVRGSSDGSCPGIPGQLPPRGPRPSSSTRSALSRLRKVRGSWSSNLRSPPSHPVCRRSRSMHRSALRTRMLTAADGPAASGSTGGPTCEDAPLAAARRAAAQPRCLRRSRAPSRRARARRAAARGARDSQGRLGAGSGWLSRDRLPHWG